MFIGKVYFGFISRGIDVNGYLYGKLWVIKIFGVVFFFYFVKLDVIYVICFLF